MLEMRIAAVEDDPFLYEVYASTRFEEVSSWGWGDAAIHSFLTMQWSMQTRSYKLQYPDSDIYLVSYEGRNIGRLMVQRTPERVCLIDIALLQGSRNRGIGSQLIQRLQQEASAQNQEIVLHVTSNNPARRLYERLGFQIQEIQDVYWKLIWKP